MSSSVSDRKRNLFADLALPGFLGIQLGLVWDLLKGRYNLPESEFEHHYMRILDWFNKAYENARDVACFIETHIVARAPPLQLIELIPSRGSSPFWFFPVPVEGFEGVEDHKIPSLSMIIARENPTSEYPVDFLLFSPLFKHYKIPGVVEDIETLLDILPLAGVFAKELGYTPTLPPAVVPPVEQDIYNVYECLRELARGNRRPVEELIWNIFLPLAIENSQELEKYVTNQYTTGLEKSRIAPSNSETRSIRYIRDRRVKELESRMNLPSNIRLVEAETIPFWFRALLLRDVESGDVVNIYLPRYLENVKPRELHHIISSIFTYGGEIALPIVDWYESIYPSNVKESLSYLPVRYIDLERERSLENILSRFFKIEQGPCTFVIPLVAWEEEQYKPVFRLPAFIKAGRVKPLEELVNKILDIFEINEEEKLRRSAEGYFDDYYSTVIPYPEGEGEEETNEEEFEKMLEEEVLALADEYFRNVSSTARVFEFNELKDLLSKYGVDKYLRYEIVEGPDTGWDDRNIYVLDLIRSIFLPRIALEELLGCELPRNVMGLIAVDRWLPLWEITYLEDGAEVVGKYRRDVCLLPSLLVKL